MFIVINEVYCSFYIQSGKHLLELGGNNAIIGEYIGLVVFYKFYSYLDYTD